MDPVLKDFFDAHRRLVSVFGSRQRRLPLDGMLVGDLGEILVSQLRGYELLEQSTAGADLRHQGVDYEVKTTQATTKRKGWAFRETTEAQVILVELDLSASTTDGVLKIWFEGPMLALEDGPLPRRRAKANGQRFLSLAALKRSGLVFDRAKSTVQNLGNSLMMGTTNQ